MSERRSISPATAARMFLATAAFMVLSTAVFMIPIAMRGPATPDPLNPRGLSKTERIDDLAARVIALESQVAELRTHHEGGK